MTDFRFKQPKLLSPSNWEAAVREMRNLTYASVPSEVLQIVLSTAKAIYTLAVAEHDWRGKDVIVGADDFLPVSFDGCRESIIIPYV